MLILSRHCDENILIGNDIIITVVAIHGDKVRLGITAPREVRVDRQEIRQRIEREGLFPPGMDRR
jgi:carbon storage regulator